MSPIPSQPIIVQIKSVHLKHTYFEDDLLAKGNSVSSSMLSTTGNATGHCVWSGLEKLIILREIFSGEEKIKEKKRR